MPALNAHEQLSTSSTSLSCCTYIVVKKKEGKIKPKRSRKEPEWGSLYPSVHAWVGV